MHENRFTLHISHNHACMCVCVPIHTHTCICICTCTCTRTHTHTHTHAHTRTSISQVGGRINQDGAIEIQGAHGATLLLRLQQNGYADVKLAGPFVTLEYCILKEVTDVGLAGLFLKYICMCAISYLIRIGTNLCMWCKIGAADGESHTRLVQGGSDA